MNHKMNRTAIIVSLCAVVGAPSVVRADEAGPPHLPDNRHFTIDPIIDGMLITGGATFDVLLAMILSSNEIRPQPPGSPDNLPSIDRGTVTQKIDPHANTYSNVGLWTAYAFAALDPILSGVRDGRNALFVDAILYAESLELTGAFTQATKIGVRRPRPIDYANCSDPQTADPAKCSSTDMQLSFFSGHASATGAVAGTATYLAFARSGPRSPRPWITLAAGALLTSFVSYERVRSGEHFPTDVIMGSLAGAGIGVLVPHLHRRPHYHENDLETPPVLIGYAPTPGGGGSVTMQMKF